MAESSVRDDSRMKLINAMDRFIASRRARNLRQTSIRTYRQILTTFLNYCTSARLSHACQVTPDVVQEYILSRMDSGVTARSLNAERGIILLMLSWLSRRGMCPPQSWHEDIPPLKVDRARTRDLTADECAQLVAAIDELLIYSQPFLRYRDAAIAALLIDSGLRASELLRLKVTDVDLKERLAFVSEEGKSRRPYVALFTAATATRLKRYLSVRERVRLRTDRFFVTVHGKTMTYNTLRHVLKRASAMAGIGNVTPHVLRHSCATILHENGLTIEDIQSQLGHANPGTTAIYLHPKMDSRRRRYDTAGPMEHLSKNFG